MNNKKIMKNITYVLFLLLFSCLAFVSCQDHDDNLPVGGSKDGVIRVAFNTPDFVQVGTRAMHESGIKDVTVLQFKEGKLVAQIFLEDKYFLNAVEVEGLVSMPSATVNTSGSLIQDGSENVLVFLANIKAMTGAEVSGFTLNTSTYSDLSAYTAVLQDADALGDLTFMPMTGTYLEGIADGTTNLISVTLARVFAKINFTLDTTNFISPNGEVPAITVNSISLHNVPLDITFFPSNRPALPSSSLPGVWPNAQTPYPAASAGSNTAAADGGIDADNFVTLTDTHNQASDKLTNFIGYMPENARGSYTNITNNKMKIPKNIETEANRVGLSYLLVDLDYETSDGVIKNATYRIYLGGDAAGDMNLLGNTQYNVTTYIYGDGSGTTDVDTRITVSDVFNPVVTGNPGNNSLQDAANSYIINTTTVNTDKPNFTIPLTQARSGWRYIQSSLRVEGDTNDYIAEFDNMIKNGWTIETLWKTWQGSNVTGAVATGIETGSGESTNRYYATLTIPSDIPVGNNCVIALKDNAGTIWWTWHLWITDYDPDNTTTKNGQTHTYFGDAFSSVGLYYNKKMMDRNLGATMTGLADDYIAAQPDTYTDAVKWYGLMYQWGRKDPFTNSRNGATAVAIIIYDSSDTQITTDSDGFPKISNNSVAINRLADAAQNPMNYYYAGLNSGWTTKDDNLWNASSKTFFDPCPAGWRVPVANTTAYSNPWAGFSDGNPSSTSSVSPGGIGVFEFWTNSGGTGGRLYDKDGTKAWYPAAGYRKATDGGFSSTGTYAYYWSSVTTASSGYRLNFTGTAVTITTASRAVGASVRCIQQ